MMPMGMVQFHVNVLVLLVDGGLHLVDDSGRSEDALAAAWLAFLVELAHDEPGDVEVRALIGDHLRRFLLLVLLALIGPRVRDQLPVVDDQGLDSIGMIRGDDDRAQFVDRDGGSMNVV